MMLFTRFDAEELCPNCQKPMVFRRAYRFPVFTQILFGSSFIFFLVLSTQLNARPYLLWGWVLIQVVLGGVLYRGRTLASQRVLRCIRCTTDLR